MSGAKLRIENQAVIFALLAKYTMESHGDEGENVIQEGMVRYGEERGKRMAANARKNGDPIALWTDQAYGEWKPDYDGQMEFGTIRNKPSYRTYISKCAWCEAWNKYDLLKYGREYCIHVDAAVYDGFQEGNDDIRVCTPVNDSMSWGGDCCRFDWGIKLSDEDAGKLAEKKKELGTSCMKDMNFHTAHMWYSMCDTIRKHYADDDAEEIINNAKKDYIDIFGQDEFDVLGDYSLSDF